MENLVIYSLGTATILLFITLVCIVSSRKLLAHLLVWRTDQDNLGSLWRMRIRSPLTVCLLGKIIKTAEKSHAMGGVPFFIQNLLEDIIVHSELELGEQAMVAMGKYITLTDTHESTLRTIITHPRINTDNGKEYFCKIAKELLSRYQQGIGVGDHKCEALKNAMVVGLKELEKNLRWEGAGNLREDVIRTMIINSASLGFSLNEIEATVHKFPFASEDCKNRTLVILQKERIAQIAQTNVFLPE